MVVSSTACLAVVVVVVVMYSVRKHASLKTNKQKKIFTPDQFFPSKYFVLVELPWLSEHSKTSGSCS